MSPAKSVAPASRPAVVWASRPTPLSHWPCAARIADTHHVSLVLRVALLFVFASASLAQSVSEWGAPINRATQAAPDARIVILDARSGHLLASHQLRAASATLAAPGSTLKPLILFQALQSNLWTAGRRVPCNGNLQIRNHRLACSHAPAPPFAAREAIAWSCNTYFAALARSLAPGQLDRMLRPTGLLGSTQLAPGEALALFHSPSSADEIQLTALGVEGIRVTPLALAVAYRWLAQQIAAAPNSIASQTVLGGLADSASFGIASQARIAAVPVAGKTGTAETTGSQQTHGWFAGWAPADNPQVVVVVYLPTGRGMDAAHIAGLLLASSPVGH